MRGGVVGVQRYVWSDYSRGGYGECGGMSAPTTQKGGWRNVVCQPSMVWRMWVCPHRPHQKGGAATPKFKSVAQVVANLGRKNKKSGPTVVPGMGLVGKTKCKPFNESNFLSKGKGNDNPNPNCQQGGYGYGHTHGSSVGYSTYY